MKFVIQDQHFYIDSLDKRYEYSAFMLPERGLDPKTQPIKPIKKLTLNAMSPPALISQSLCKNKNGSDVQKRCSHMFVFTSQTQYNSKVFHEKIEKQDIQRLYFVSCKLETFDAVWTYCTDILRSSNIHCLITTLTQALNHFKTPVFVRDMISQEIFSSLVCLL